VHLGIAENGPRVPDLHILPISATGERCLEIDGALGLRTGMTPEKRRVLRDGGDPTSPEFPH